VITFLDLDGVIIDSIEECFEVSKKTYYKNKNFSYLNNRYREFFFQYRGLVNPPYEYFCLHESIEYFYKKKFDDEEFYKFFKKSSGDLSSNKKHLLEQRFFNTRKIYQEQDFKSWIKMNPLTDFGKNLKNKKHKNTFIITTKDLDASKKILNFYEIEVENIYSNVEVRNAGSKGQLINQVMKEKNGLEGIFIDDSTEHLDTVYDKRIKCFFADWGYGKNTNYEVFNMKI
tara:strand:- start:65 stop:751 length:687 start_codon:yes stop_codon:yes gene_type:complete